MYTNIVGFLAGVVNAILIVVLALATIILVAYAVVDVIIWLGKE